MSFAVARKKPHPLKAIAFIDGQNLFHSVKEAFGYFYPNFDPKCLAQAVCGQQGWELTKTRFYTGIPKIRDNPFWHHFWSAKLGKLKKRQNVFVFSRLLQYRKKKFVCPEGHEFIATIGDEKGIDVRIAIDAVSLGYRQKYDVALIFSQDQDLSEVADDIREIAAIQDRYIKIATAFPKNTTQKHLNRGINKTDWITFDKDLYDSCLDPRDYRAK